MRTLISGGLVLAFLSGALAQGNHQFRSLQRDPILSSNPPDAICGAGESERNVTIGDGDSYEYKTSARSVKLGCKIFIFLFANKLSAASTTTMSTVPSTT